jgi:hypothetical protein
MSETRVVKYNEDLFKIPSGTQKRKKGGAANRPPIKIKPVTSKTIKQRVLKEIRENQEKQYKSLIGETAALPLAPSNKVETEFDKDFQKSVEYMKEFADKHKEEVVLNKTLKQTGGSGFSEPPKFGCLKNGNLPTYRSYHNKTVKQVNGGAAPYVSVMPMGATNPVTQTATSPMIQPLISNATSSMIQPVISHATSPMIQPVISHATSPMISHATSPVIQPSLSSVVQPSISPATKPVVNQAFTPSGILNARTAVPLSLITADEVGVYPKGVQRYKGGEKTIAERIKSPAELLLIEKTKQKPKINPANKKIKKIMRRTYRTGKDRYRPRVSVLLPNKTIRRNITTKSYLLKQTPIDEIRKTLLKQGFIKVGSSAPNDVLRKMYESIQMIGGDINNHNPDNLLFNFFNEKHKS